MSEAKRQRFIAQFQPNPERSMTAFIVLGGVFSEGVDLPAERLCGAAIVGVGLPQVGVERDTPDAPALLVGGADLLDGTPVFDIKPYIPLSDCRPEALPGYTAQTRGHCLRVECPEALLALIPPDKRQALLGVLACDPRPGYEDKPQEIYGLAFAGLDVGFQVQGEVLRVVRVNHQKGE